MTEFYYLCTIIAGIMAENELQRVTRSFMQDLYEEQDGGRCASDGLLMIRRLGERSSQVFGSGGPFQIDHLHIGIVVNGEQDVTVNLRRHHLTKGSVLVSSPESIMQQDGRTENFDMQVIHMSDELLHRLFGDQVPRLYTHRMSEQSLYLDDASFALLLAMLDSLWQSVLLGHEEDGDFKSPQANAFTATRDHLLTAILSLITDLSQRDKQAQESHQPRNVIVFNRFLSLVAEHCDRQRTLDFYADRLCLSKQYLDNIL